jgi:hypothetical protein
MDYSSVGNPWARLGLAMLDRAKKDAMRGSVEALNWLDDEGVLIADAIVDGSKYAVRSWVLECTAKLLVEGELWTQLELVPDNVL